MEAVISGCHLHVIHKCFIVSNTITLQAELEHPIHMKVLPTQYHFQIHRLTLVSI